MGLLGVDGDPQAGCSRWIFGMDLSSTMGTVYLWINSGAASDCPQSIVSPH